MCFIYCSNLSMLCFLFRKMSLEVMISYMLLRFSLEAYNCSILSLEIS